jgi:hypothetical protein
MLKREEAIENIKDVIAFLEIIGAMPQIINKLEKVLKFLES